MKWFFNNIYMIIIVYNKEKLYFTSLKIFSSDSSKNYISISLICNYILYNNCTSTIIIMETVIFLVPCFPKKYNSLGSEINYIILHRWTNIFFCCPNGVIFILALLPRLIHIIASHWKKMSYVDKEHLNLRIRLVVVEVLKNMKLTTAIAS